MRISAWERLDGTATPLHARLTVLPGLAPDERVLLAGRLAAVAGVPPAELVLRAADIPGAIVPPDAPGLDEALASARRRQAEEASLATAAEAADLAVDTAEAAAAEAAGRLAVVTSHVDRAAAELAETNATTEWLRADRDALASVPVPLRPPSDIDLAAATSNVEACRQRLATAEDCRAEAPAELIEALESAHDSLAETESRGGILARRRLPELRARQAAAAAAIGVPSYEAWLVRSSGLLPVRDEARIAEARQALAEAEATATALMIRAEDGGQAARRAELARRQAIVADSETRNDAAARVLAEARAEHDRARLDLDDAERALADARADRDAIGTIRAGRTRSPERTTAVKVDLAHVDAAELELGLLSRLVAHESTGRPLLVDDAFAELDADRRVVALDVLAWASEAVQIVYLEAGRTIATKVAELGPALASVVDLHDGPDPG